MGVAMRRFIPGLALALLTAAGLLLGSGASARAQDPPPAGYEAWIDIAQEGALWRVAPFCRAPEDAELTYRLSARKTGRAGVSNSAQSGRVRARAGQAQVVAHLSLGIQPGDSYEFVLEIFQDGRKVAEAVAASPRGI
jgi:curli production protein